MSQGLEARSYEPVARSLKSEARSHDLGAKSQKLCIRS